MTIAVTTPTGHVGSRVVQLLLQAGAETRVLVRDPGKLPAAVREKADVRTGDLFSADFVSDATAGADTLFWVVPESFTATDPVGDMARMAAHAARAIRVNGVRRVVMLSSVGAELRHGAGMIDGLGRTELQLDASGADVTILRCGYFFTNLLGNLDELRAGVLSTTMTPTVPMPWVDPRDIAEVAAVRLLNRDWSGRTVRGVFGPEDLSWAGVAMLLSEALGRKIELNVLTDDELRLRLTATGLPGGAIEGIVGMTAGLRDDFTPELTRDWLSSTPSTLEAWTCTTLLPLLKD